MAIQKKNNNGQDIKNTNDMVLKWATKAKEAEREKEIVEYFMLFVVVYIGDFYPPASLFAWIYSVATTQKKQREQTKPERKKKHSRNVSPYAFENCVQCMCVYLALCEICLNWNRLRLCSISEEHSFSVAHHNKILPQANSSDTKKERLPNNRIQPRKKNEIINSTPLSYTILTNDQKKGFLWHIQMALLWKQVVNI